MFEGTLKAPSPYGSDIALDLINLVEQCSQIYINNKNIRCKTVDYLYYIVLVVRIAFVKSNTKHNHEFKNCNLKYLSIL